MCWSNESWYRRFTRGASHIHVGAMFCATLATVVSCGNTRESTSLRRTACSLEGLTTSPREGAEGAVVLSITRVEGFLWWSALGRLCHTDGCGGEGEGEGDEE